LKKWFINRFPELLMVICFCYVGYDVGARETKHDLLDNTRKCTHKLLDDVDKDTLTKFYNHKIIVGNIWIHAEAYVEHTWAKCFRKELYK